MVPFAGWEMPIQYAGITEEHRAVRTAAGLFDVSHMGELELSGDHAVDVVNQLVTNDAVAGDTVWGNDPGAEAQPKYDEHDPQDGPDDGILTEEDVEEEGI